MLARELDEDRLERLPAHDDLGGEEVARRQKANDLGTALRAGPDEERRRALDRSHRIARPCRLEDCSGAPRLLVGIEPDVQALALLEHRLRLALGDDPAGLEDRHALAQLL